MDAVKVIKKSGAPGAVPAVTAYVDEPLLPKVSAEDAGKVIGVDENGELEAISAGGGETPIEPITIVIPASDLPTITSTYKDYAVSDEIYHGDTADVNNIQRNISVKLYTDAEHYTIYILPLIEITQTAGYEIVEFTENGIMWLLANVRSYNSETHQYTFRVRVILQV